MTSPDRLLQSSQSSLVRALLETGLADQPRADAAQRVAAALGVGTGLATSANLASAAAAKTMTVASVGAATSAVGLSVLGKAVLLGTMAAVAVAGGAHGVSKLVTSEERPIIPTAPTPAQPAARPFGPWVQPSTLPAPTPTAAPPEEPKHRVDRAAAGAPPDFSAAPRPAPDDPASQLYSGKLRQEVEKIDAARRAVAAMSPVQALRHLDEYATPDRTGTLDQEAQVLRVEALLQSGRREEAAAIFVAYQQRYAADRYTEKMRALLSQP